MDRSRHTQIRQTTRNLEQIHFHMQYRSPRDLVPLQFSLLFDSRDLQATLISILPHFSDNGEHTATYRFSSVRIDWLGTEDLFGDPICKSSKNIWVISDTLASMSTETVSARTVGGWYSWPAFYDGACNQASGNH
jgi:hypothetical protein